jgi:hypothetical protein
MADRGDHLQPDGAFLADDGQEPGCGGSEGLGVGRCEGQTPIQA